MRYFDVASFEVESGLCKRLGYKRIYCVGKDVSLLSRPDKKITPQIIVSRDVGVLIGALRDNDVAGIIFQDNELVKKVIEKAAELEKTVFVPINQLMEVTAQERGSRLNKMRRIITSSHKLGAKVRIISLAGARYQLLSAAQMNSIAKFMLKDGERIHLFGGDIL